jgi:hypothetical protein
LSEYDSANRTEKQPGWQNEEPQQAAVCHTFPLIFDDISLCSARNG